MLKECKSKHFELKLVKKGIYAALAKDGGGAVGNAGFIDLGDQTIVFDTFNTQQAALDLKKFAEDITGRPVSCVVNSHYHGDHIRGNQVFSLSHIVSSEHTYRLIKDIQPERIDKQKQDQEGLKNYIQSLQIRLEETNDESIRTHISFLEEMAISLPDLSLTLPTCSFRGSFNIYGSKRTAKIVTMGAGHSPCDSFLYIPEEKVIFMGDLLFVNNHPSFFDESDLENWVQTLQELHTWDIETVVPGHGSLGTKDDLLMIVQYIKDLQVLAESADANKQIEIPLSYKTWGVPELFAKNLEQLQTTQKQQE